MGLADVKAEDKKESVPKPRKPRKAKENPKDTATIETMVKAVYGIAANRLGPVWNITDEEAKSIAVPLASILARYEKLIMVSQYSDVAMLLMAVGGVTIPRLVVTVQARKEEKRANERPAKQSDRPDNVETPGNVSGSIKERIPSLVAESF